MKRLTISILISLLLALSSSLLVLAGDNSERPPRSLPQAAMDGDVNEVQLLISQGADIHGRIWQGWTPLHIAALRGNVQITQLLIDNGADVNARDINGGTALHIAADAGYKDIVQLLISHNANINVVDSMFNNALSLARNRNYIEVVELLLKNGAKEPGVAEPYTEVAPQSRPVDDQGFSSMPPGSDYETFSMQEQDTQRNIPKALLADPNEITGRIKTFEGLEKELELLDGRSRPEIIQWLQQTRVNNNAMLAQAVYRQIRTEMQFIQDIAVKEKTEKTTAAIESHLSSQQQQLKQLVNGIQEQLKTLRPTRGIRGRAQTTYTDPSQYAQGQPTRGRRGVTYPPTASNSGNLAGGQAGVLNQQDPRYAAQGQAAGQQQMNQVDITPWLSADLNSKISLAGTVYDQAYTEFEAIRKIAVTEEAKKTTAAIDGILLNRQTRYEKLVKAMQEQLLKMQGQWGTNPGAAGGTGAESQVPIEQAYPRGRAGRR